jgi:phage-related protein
LIELIAPDWRFYSQTEKTTSIDRNDDETIINAGNERTCPVLRINGPITTAEIVNLTTNQTVNLTHTLLEGEYIDIDCLNQTIVDNEGTDLYNAFDDSPEFPCLDPGTNSVQFSSTGDGAATQLDVVFRDAYNGI